MLLFIVTTCCSKMAELPDACKQNQSRDYLSSLWLQIDNTAPMNGTTAFEPFLSSCKSNQGEKTQNVGMTLGNPFFFRSVVYTLVFVRF